MPDDKEEAPAPKDDLLKYKVAKRSYVLAIRKRVSYTKAFNPKKKFGEKEENPIAKFINPLLASFGGKKEKR